MQSKFDKISFSMDPVQSKSSSSMERRWVSRGFQTGCTAEVKDDSSLGPPMAFLA